MLRPHVRLGMPLSLAAVLVLSAAGHAAAASGPQVFTATLTGAQQVPTVASPGTGTGTVVLNAAETQITVNLTFSGLTSVSNAAHIHGSAPAGLNAAVLFDFTAAATGGTSGTMVEQTFAITPAQVADLKAGLFYFNVHTLTNSGGEIRGQIGLAATQYNTTLTGAQQVPTVSSPGTGTGTVALNASETLLFVNLSFSGLTSPAILAHIHGPAAAGLNGAVLFDFASVVPNATSGSISQQTFAITPAQVAELKAGLYYFNVHTSNFTGGEIRGQINPPPTFTLDRTSLGFAAANSGLAFPQKTPNQTVRLLQSGTGTGSWTATAHQPWITVSPSSGTGTALITIGVQFSGSVPIAGRSTGTVTFDVGVGPIDVALTTIAAGAGQPATGLFETPTQGATGVTGSVAVTGWAIDDIGVTRVRILREAVLPSEGSSLVFIGDATLVDGSRSDIALAFPNAPLNTRAGWGYLLLTNFLPNQGNGTFVLHAIADDVDGHSFELGTKTITCSNDSAVKPFGAIDTPGQGDTISGAAFANFGWVLSRTPALAYPPNGTVQVVVDGVFLPQAPIGWVSREDLTNLFPATIYPGVANALGVATLDTTALTNAVHTIAWVVTDDRGQADGIGSRFFTVANGSGLTLGSTAKAPVMASRDDAAAARLLTSPIVARRGFDDGTPYRSFAVGAAGRATIQGEELDRFEVRLRSDLEPAAGPIAGYQRVGNALVPLPIGSHLDPETGVFTWQPGVGFLHTYDFVFVRGGAARDAVRQELRIVINPKGSNRVGPQVVIDTPGAGAVVGREFTIAGWGVDVDSDWGAGVDTLHVWAYPRATCQVPGATCTPIFLGAAAYGGRRPDVAAIFGERFGSSGYSLSVDSLPPGEYDIAVFAWSTVTGGFVPAKVVHVEVR